MTESINVITQKLENYEPLPHRNGVTIAIRGDSLTVVSKIKKRDSNTKILVLNFANNYSFRDNKTAGSTQEDDIAKRTNLCDGLSRELYPISDPYEKPTFLLSQNVQILKDKYGKSIEPMTIDIISSAAIRCPRYTTIDYDSDKHGYKRDEDEDVMFKKVENIVKKATCYDVFITGAWGMGQFCNPKYGLINIWNKVLKKYKVPLTIFAIPDRNTMRYFKLFLHQRENK